jgi:Domain of unknown function (DUF4180)
MALTTAEEDGVRFVEGAPDQALLANAQDINRVIEACLSIGSGAALLYASNLTSGFFDLSSGDAGTILQKLRNYRIRLAVVCPPDAVRFSSRFGEMVAEERRGRHFGVFENRVEAADGLKQGSVVAGPR